MNKIVNIVDGELRLTSNIDEYAFGKTNFSSIVTQQGLIFDGKDFTPWSFSDVKSFDVPGKLGRIVFYCGKNPLSASAKSLLEYFEDDDAGEENATGAGNPTGPANDTTGNKNSTGSEVATKKFQAVYAVIKAFTQAAKTGKKIPLLGAGGILVDTESENPKILFLPEDLYKNTVSGLDAEDYLKLQGGWVNQTIYDLPAICFERAVLAYKLLTGNFPYPNPDQIERNADILDRKFLPLEMCLNEIDPTLAKEINKALKLNSNVVNIPGKKQKGKDSEDLTPSPDFPLEKLETAYQLSLSQKNLTDNQTFKEKAQTYIKLRDSKIATKRKIRRNSAKIVVGAIIALIFVIITINTVNANLTEYTTKGLSSVETIQGFFMGVNVKNTTLLSNFTKGKKTQNYVDTISQIYVLSKQRQLYDKDNGFANPANWLLYSNNAERYENGGLYGITHLTIDGKPYDSVIQLYKRNQNPPAVTQEGNITLENKAKSIHQVQYYLLHSEGEDNAFIVEKVTDTFTLTYQKDRWIITSIESNPETLKVSSSAFKTDYLNQLIVTNGDVLQAVENLREKYPWLPTKEALTYEKNLMEYNANHPFDQVEFLF